MRSTRTVWPGAVALTVVLLAGALCLAVPFWGDQALFTVYARELSHGAVLYRDVFDVKQPGIFVFYAVAGSLFGFTEVGIHLFELVYWLAFSIFALVALRPYFATRWGPALVPILTIAAYYASSGLLELTQLEILVAFPILVAWWAVDRADPSTRHGRRRYALAGLAAASVVLLKYLYLVIVLAFVVRAVVRARRDGRSVRELIEPFVAFSVAMTIPLLAATVYFAIYGQLGRIWWAYFELSPAAQLGGSRPASYLVLGARRYAIGFAPLLILATYGAVRAFRERVSPWVDLVSGMVLWGATGAIAFLVQGWPQYKWALFTVPLGIVAAVGVERLAVTSVLWAGRGWIALAAASVVAAVTIAGLSDRSQTLLLLVVAIGIAAAAVAAWPPGRSRLRGIAAVAILVALVVSFGLAAIAPTEKVRRLVDHDLALTVAAREAFRGSLNGSYLDADEDVEALGDAGVRLGSLYVFGDPVVLLRAGQRQAVPILGWGPEGLDERAWRELEADLRTVMPRSIVVDDVVGATVARSHPSILDWIETHYEVALEGEVGTWYELRDAEERSSG